MRSGPFPDFYAAYWHPAAEGFNNTAHAYYVQLLGVMVRVIFQRCRVHRFVFNQFRVRFMVSGSPSRYAYLPLQYIDRRGILLHGLMQAFQICVFRDFWPYRRGVLFGNKFTTFVRSNTPSHHLLRVKHGGSIDIAWGRHLVIYTGSDWLLSYAGIWDVAQWLLVSRYSLGEIGKIVSMEKTSKGTFDQ